MGFGDIDVFGFGAEVNDSFDVEIVGEECAVSGGGGVRAGGAVENVGSEGGGVG